MSISADEFWDRLRDSLLLAPAQVKALRAKIDETTRHGTSSTKIAKLLVANELLTKPQAQQLLAESGPAAPPIQPIPPSIPPIIPPAIRVPEPPLIHADASQSQGVDRKSAKVPPAAALLSLFLVVVLIAGGAWWHVASRPLLESAVAPSEMARAEGAVANRTTATRALVDSGGAIWARAQSGRPIELRYAPRGVQMIAHVRLAALLAHPEGEKVVRSLGPESQNALTAWLDRVGVARESLQTLDFYLLPLETTFPQVVTVGTLSAGASHESLRAFAIVDERRIAPLAADAVWFPADDLQTFVVGPTDVVSALQHTEPPVLRRELEQLRLASHDTDHLTVLANPNFLRYEAQGLFPNTRRRLLNELCEFWSDEAQAISVGFQFSDVATAEVRMIAREDLPARQFAARVQGRIQAMPARLRDFLGRVHLDKFWQPLAIRFPAMVRFAADQSRVVSEGRQVAVSVALPAEAVHNLLLAAELSLASPVDPPTAVVDLDRSGWTIEDVLATTTSVRFDQKSLDLAMRDVAMQVRDDLPGLPFPFTVEVIRADLEPEGITRNQQIRDFNEANRSLSEILSALVMQANPVQTVTSLTETDQQLVWVVSPDEPGKIMITTRKAAESRRLTLPEVFYR